MCIAFPGDAGENLYRAGEWQYGAGGLSVGAGGRRGDLFAFCYLQIGTTVC